MEYSKFTSLLSKIEIAPIGGTATQFKLAPKIMVVRLGDWKLPEQLMVVGQWVGLVLISVILLTLTLMAGA